MVSEWIPSERRSDGGPAHGIYDGERDPDVDDILVTTDSYARRIEVLQALYTGVASAGCTLARQKTDLFSRSIQFPGW